MIFMNEHESCEDEINELKEILFNIKELWDNGWFTQEDENYVMFVEQIKRIDSI